jgi:subtilisin family serine protease
MFKFFTLLSVLMCLSSSAFAQGGAKNYIVVLKDDTKSVPDVANQMAKSHAFHVDKTLEHALKGFISKLSDLQANKLKIDSRVKYVEEDVNVFATARGGRPKPLTYCGDKICNGLETCTTCSTDCGVCPPSCGDHTCNGTETCTTCSTDCGACPPPPPAPTGCAAEPAQVISYGTTRVGGGTTTSTHTAWVIDTGIDLDHCDLNVDVARSKSFVSTEPSADDLNGHGTHVAGIIAAKNNTIDTVGVAPGSLVVAVKALDTTGSGALSAIVSAVDYVASRASLNDVVNMSLGFAGYSQTLNDAIINTANKGILFAIAAGNNAAAASGYSPASTNHVNVLTVSAIDNADKFASFSNYGSPPVDFAAPGVSIQSLKMGGGTKFLSGTSMATPHVAGLLLLGMVQISGRAVGDPDGNPDPIAHH